MKRTYRKNKRDKYYCRYEENVPVKSHVTGARTCDVAHDT